MNIFTANQVNQVYVLKSNSSVVATLDADHQITKANNPGSVGLGKTADGKSIYFKHLGAGGLTRSDLIEIANIIDIKATVASKMARPLTAAKVTLNTEALSDSKPVAGEDFILRLKFQNPVGMSPENQYWKYGVVHATATMTASEFYLKLASSIAKNMAREAVQLVKVYVTYSTSSKTEITKDSNVSDTTTFNQTYTGVQIEEVEQEWILGIKQDKPLVFTVEPTWVKNGNAEVVWGDVVYNNSKKTVGGAVPSVTTVNSGAPSAGDSFHIMETEQEARTIANKRMQLQREQSLRTTTTLSLEEIAHRVALGEFHELNLVVKADTQGSCEALSDSFIKMSTEKVQVNVIMQAVGQISENDVMLASTAENGMIVGFQVRPSVAAKRLAEQEGVEINTYSVIYDAMDDIKAAMEGMLDKIKKEVATGQAEVKEVFKISKVGLVAGALVTEGKIHAKDKARLIRDGIVIFTGELNALKRYKDDAKEVASGLECGISLVNCNDIQAGDIIETFTEIEVEQKL